MKTILYILLMILLVTPIAFAEDMITVDDVRVFVNDDEQSGIDEDGGKIELKQGDDLELNVVLFNHYNESIEATVYGTIYDIDRGNDLEEDTTKTVKIDDDKTILLFFEIPSRATTRTSDMELEITYKLNNGSDYSILLDDFLVDVSENTIAEEEAEKSNIDLVGSFSNLSNTCSNLLTNMNSCFNCVDERDNAKDELGTCKEERGTYQANANECDANLGACKGDKTNLENDNNRLTNDLNSRPTWATCNNMTSAAVDKKESERNNFWFLVVGGLVVGYFVVNRKKRGESMKDVYEYAKR